MTLYDAYCQLTLRRPSVVSTRLPDGPHWSAACDRHPSSDHYSSHHATHAEAFAAALAHARTHNTKD